MDQPEIRVVFRIPGSGAPYVKAQVRSMALEELKGQL